MFFTSIMWRLQMVRKLKSIIGIPVPMSAFKTFCNTCKINVDKFTHLCFLQPVDEEELKKKQLQKRGIFLFLDMETLRCDDGKLAPNLIVVQDEHANEWVYPGLEAVDDFATSLFSQSGELFQATLGKHQFARIFAPNGSCFDYFPFVDKKDPDVIFDVSSIICIKVFDNSLIFMDSFRFLPMWLADMPTTFGVSDVAKGFFSYRLNTLGLWDKCIPKPEIEDFEPDFMLASKRSEFLQWYRSAIEEPYMQRLQLVDAGQDILCTYDIFAENLKYCCDDACVLFEVSRSLHADHWYHAWRHNLTIASYCNFVWKAKFLEPGTVGLVLHKGYVHKDSQSKIALSWLKFLDICHFEGQLKYARKNCGEHKVENTKCFLEEEYLK